MRWMLLTETYPPEINGVAMTLSRLVDGLVGKGHHVKIIRPKQNRHDRDSLPGENPSHRLVWSTPLPWYTDLKIGWPYIGQLRTNIRKFKPDFIHLATEGPLGLAGLLAAHAYGIPVVSSYHTNFLDYSRQYKAGALRKAAFEYFRALHNVTIRTFVPSTTVMHRLYAYRFKNLMVMSRGVDTELFSPQRRSEELRQSWGAKPEDPVMLYVGRVAVEKNMSLMMEAYKRGKAQNPALKLVIVGDGPERAGLQKAYPEVIFAGKRTKIDLARHYASADLFAFASFTETYGNVVIEAMASGLVTLSYDYAASREHVEDGVNGFLAPYKKDAEFLEIFEKKILNHPEQWQSIAKQAREKALRLSWEKVVAKYESDLLALQDDV